MAEELVTVSRLRFEGFEEGRRKARQIAAELDKIERERRTGIPASQPGLDNLRRGAQDAAVKLDRLIREQELAVRIARQHNISTQAAGRAVRAFAGDIDRAEREAATYALRLDAVRRETRALSTTSGGLLSQLSALRTTIYAVAGAVGLGFLINQAREALKAELQLEAATRALSVAAGGPSGGAESLAFVRSEADRLGLSLGGTAQDFGKLAAASIGTSLQGERTRDIFSAVSEASAKLGLSGSDAEGVLRAIGQMMSKGKVQAEELRGQLGERLPGAFQIMARAIGVSTQELDGMLERGEVMAEDVLPKFAAELRKTFGTDAETRVETTAATIARLETALFNLRQAGAELALQRGGLADYAELLNVILQRAAGAGEAATEAERRFDPFAEAVESLGLAAYVTVKAQKALGMQTVEVATWFDKQRKAMSDALVVHERYQEATKTTVSWQEAMERAGKKSAEAEKKAEKERGEIARKQAARQKEGERLAAALLSAQEKLDAEMREAIALNREGYLSLEDLARAQRRYDEQSRQLRTEQFIELRDRIADAKQELLDLAALEEVDIRIRLDLEKLDVDKIVEEIQGQFDAQSSGLFMLPFGVGGGSPADPLGLFDVDRIVASYDGIRKSTAEQLRQLDAMTGSFDLIALTFEQIGGSLGQLIAKLAKAAGNISASVADIQAGGAQGGALGALGVVGGVIGIFTEVYALGQSMLADAKAKRFGLPITAEVTGGKFRAQAVGTGAVSQAQALETVAAWRSAINDFREAVGGLLVDLPEIGTRVRGDGKEVELTVGGVVYGIFDSLEEAFEAGLRIAVGQANIEGIGPIVAEALRRVTASTMDELLELLPVLRELDDVAAGLTAGYSRAKVAEDAFRTGLDIEAEKLLAHGAALADVVAWRQREIDKQQELLRVSGNALAGVSNSFGQLQEWMDSVKAFNDAQGEEAARLAALTEVATNRQTNPDIFTGGPGPVGGGGGTPGGTGLDPEGAPGAGLRSTRVAMRETGRAAEEAAEASRELTDAYVEQIRESVRLKAQVSFLGALADFQDTYGVKLSGNASLREQIAEMEFREAQIRIQLLAEELAANAELLGLTRAQVEQYRRWAGEIAGATFQGLAPTGAGAARRQQKKEEERRAAEEAAKTLEDFRKELLALELNADTASGSLGDLNARLDELRRRAQEAAEAGATPEETRRFQQLGLRSERETLLEPFRATRRDSFLERSFDVERYRRDALAQAELIAQAQAETLGIPFERAFASMAEEIDRGAKRMQGQLVREVIDALDLPLETVRREGQQLRAGMGDLRQAFGAGAISARRYADLVGQIQRAQESAIGGEVLGLLDRYYKDVEGYEEFRRADAALTFEQELAAARLRFEMAVAEGALAQEAIERIGGFLTFMESNSPDWDAIFAEAPDAASRSFGGRASASSTAAGIDDLARAIRDFVAGFERVDVGRFEAQARDWTTALEDFDRRIGEALGQQGVGTTLKNLSASLFGVTDLLSLTDEQLSRLGAAIPAGNVFREQLLEAIEILQAANDLPDIRAAMPEKILSMYRGALESGNELERQWNAIQSEYMDAVAALELLGANAEQLAEAEAIRQEVALSFWADVIGEVRSLGDEIRGGAFGSAVRPDLRVADARARYEELRRRIETDPLDFEAWSQIRQAARDFAEAEQSYTGGAGADFGRVMRGLLDFLDGLQPPPTTAPPPEAPPEMMTALDLQTAVAQESASTLVEMRDLLRDHGDLLAQLVAAQQNAAGFTVSARE